MERANGIAATLGRNVVKRRINNALGNRFLAVEHHTVGEFADDQITEFGIRENFSFFLRGDGVTYQ